MHYYYVPFTSAENFTLNSNLIINSNKQVEVLLTAHNMNVSENIFICASLKLMYNAVSLVVKGFSESIE